MLSLLNKLKLQKELQTFVTNNVFLNIDTNISDFTVFRNINTKPPNLQHGLLLLQTVDVRLVPLHRSLQHELVVAALALKLRQALLQFLHLATVLQLQVVNLQVSGSNLSFS